MSGSYGTQPHDYLARAKRRLLSPNPEDLIYAALELRCCIEGRQAIYQSAMEWRNGSKVKAWKLDHLARHLRIYWKNPTISEITYHLPEGDWKTYFTPVSETLLKTVTTHIGQLMHLLPEALADDENWWERTRTTLLEIYRETWIACRGEHMAMPLWRASTQELHPAFMCVPDEDAEKLLALKNAFDENRTLSFSIAYLSIPPSTWKPDL